MMISNDAKVKARKELWGIFTRANRVQDYLDTHIEDLREVKGNYTWVLCQKDKGYVIATTEGFIDAQGKTPLKALKDLLRNIPALNSQLNFIPSWGAL